MTDQSDFQLKIVLCAKILQQIHISKGIECRHREPHKIVDLNSDRRHSDCSRFLKKAHYKKGFIGIILFIWHDRPDMIPNNSNIKTDQMRSYQEPLHLKT